MDKVDCLVISHNRPQTLRRCVESLRKAADAALDKAIFVIHVQDDSTEGYEEIKLICEQNGAVLHHTAPMCNAEAWDAGLAHCNGQYIKILFDDDWVDENYFLATVPTLQHITDANLVITAANVIFEDRNPLLLYAFKEGVNCITSEEFVDNCKGYNRVFPESPSVCLFRNTGNNVRIRYKEFEGSKLEDAARRVYFNDLLMLIDVARSNKIVAFIGHPFVYLGTDAESLTLTKPEAVGNARLIFQKEYSGI